MGLGLLDDLVAAAATIGSPAPLDAPGLDYFDGASDEFREEVELFLSDRRAWERKGESQRNELLALSVDGFREQWSAGVSPADAAEFQGDFGDWLYQSVQAALAPGAEGWTDDNIATESPWGFDPGAISVPVKVWHGLDDRFTPIGPRPLAREHDPASRSRVARRRRPPGGSQPAHRRGPRMAGAHL